MQRTLVLEYDGEQVSYDVRGATVWGDDRVLVEEDDNLVAAAPWAADGFTIAPFLPPDAFRALCDGVRGIIIDCIRQTGLEVPDHLDLARYHEIVTTDHAHQAVADLTRRCFPVTRLSLPVAAIERRISEIVGIGVTCVPPHTEFPPHFCVRVVRPRSGDNNPPHRDVWLDRLRHAINIYAPLAGSSAQSSLPLVPGSHLWRESDIERTADGALVNDIVYTVPCVVSARKPLTLVRPDPAPNEVLVFSPYLIHGGAFNQQTARTRVSLEMRFWRTAA